MKKLCKLCRISQIAKSDFCFFCDYHISDFKKLYEKFPEKKDLKNLKTIIENLNPENAKFCLELLRKTNSFYSEITSRNNSFVSSKDLDYIIKTNVESEYLTTLDLVVICNNFPNCKSEHSYTKGWRSLYFYNNELILEVDESESFLNPKLVFCIEKNKLINLYKKEIAKANNMAVKNNIEENNIYDFLEL